MSTDLYDRAKSCKLRGLKQLAVHIKGPWSDYKRLNGRKGPLGRSISETEDGCVVVFDIDTLSRYFKWDLHKGDVCQSQM